MTERGRWERYWRFLTSGFRPEVRDEIAFHVEQRTRLLMEQGMTSEDARREAYNRVKTIIIPNMFYRTDIGERWTQDGDLLHTWGFLA